ncbi:MAG TPA: hypothetical protein VJ787_02490 [Thermoleophilia bacterium]|nr:hypothetical protein [Thermoleophilia bacterium]
MTREPPRSVSHRPASTIRRPGQAGVEGDSAVRNGDEGLSRVWGIAACDLCGRTILLGEHATHLTSGGRVIRVCAACAAGPGAEGDRRAA